MKKKIMITYITLLLIGTFTTGFIAFQFLDKIYNKNLTEKLTSNLNVLQETLLLLEQENKDINFFNLAQKFSKKIDERVTFITSDGKVLADSTNNSIIFENYISKPEIIDSSRGRIGISRRRSLITGEDNLYISYPAIKVNNQDIIIRLSSSMDEIHNLKKSFIHDILISIVFGLFIASFIGFFYINKIIKPIKDLTNASKSISSGNLDQRVDVKSNDEIEELANSFNHMISKLNIAIEELNYKNGQLDDILTSMLNGVIAIDNNGRIIISNPTAQKLLNLNYNQKNKIDNEFFDKNNLHKDIFYAIKFTMDNKISKEWEVNLNDEQNRILKIYTSPIESKNSTKNTYGVLAIIQDITQIRKLENMRIEFVSNVSHELRTPLTSISGFVETLQDWDCLNDKNRKKILNIIELETERLKSLINDILTLSEIENINTTTYKTSVDINLLINDILFFLTPILKNKSLNIICDIQEDINLINSNPSWLKQMILNIIDNAIKYSKPFGTIDIKAYQANNHLLISIKDHGIGIPKDSIPRILERFYRVDKARSRTEGGTGLGLAIVKHIVMELNGSIEVKSELDKGSEFIVSLPY